MSFKNVGKVWSIPSYEEYLKTIKPPSWAKSVTMHHTSSPSLAMRPIGLTAQHIINIRDYYKGKGWGSGPHFFGDDDDISGMTPPNEYSIHAPAFNRNSISYEVLGDYDKESPLNNRGFECWKLAADWAFVTLEWLGLKANTKTVHFHRDDPNTSKTCPGTKVEKNWFIDMVKAKDFLKKPDILVAPESFPVAEYVVSKKGYTYDDVKKLLKIKNGLVFFGEDWLENGFYDKAKQTTVAPLKELDAIVKKGS